MGDWTLDCACERVKTDDSVELNEGSAELGDDGRDVGCAGKEAPYGTGVEEAEVVNTEVESDM